MRGGPRGPPRVSFDEQERLPTPFHHDARHVLAGIVKGRVLPRAPVRAERLALPFTASETVVLLLDEARSLGYERKNAWVGLKGFEPSSHRVRAEYVSR